MKALCFGSLNIDYTYQVDHFVARGETLLSGDLQVFSGGKGLNQSIALSRAGVETCHAGSVGEDGRFLLRQLQEAGVDTGCVTVRDDVRTGHAIIQNSPDGDNCILLYGGANQMLTEAYVDEVLSNFSAGDILLLQNEVNQMHAAWQGSVRVIAALFGVPVLLAGLGFIALGIFIIVKGKTYAAAA